MVPVSLLRHQIHPTSSWGCLALIFFADDVDVSFLEMVSINLMEYRLTLDLDLNSSLIFPVTGFP